MRRRNWLRRGKVRNSKSSSPRQASGRLLRMEVLDPRKMLSINVNTLVDEADGNIFDGDVSLRDAIAAASMFGGETIEFSVTGTINLSASLGSLVIDKSLTINGPGASLLTIDAGQQFRAIDVTAFPYVGNVELRGITITGGKTTGNNAHALDYTHSGGGIRTQSIGNLIVVDSVIEGNSTTGQRAWGGGIFALAKIELRNSTVSGNSTIGLEARGGGIATHENGMAIYLSAIENNSTAGNQAAGGGIYSRGYVFALQTTISGNMTSGDLAQGGGIFGSDVVKLVETTVSDNHTTGSESHGGGIYSDSPVLIRSSTVSGNSTLEASSNGGGIYLELPSFGGNAVHLDYSTVTQNHAGGIGGGINALSVIGRNSIIAGNTADAGSRDVQALVDPNVFRYNLVGDNEGTGQVEAQTPDAFGNLIGSSTGMGVIDPLLGPLQDNGGPTFTHALLPGTPAINAGDPSAQPQGLTTGVPFFDQRGNNYGRVQNSRIDMGAFEVRETVSADFDSDGFVTGLDFLAWQLKLNNPTPIEPPLGTKADGDADNDRDVDVSDLAVWEIQFGGPAPLAATLTMVSPVEYTAVSFAADEMPLTLSRNTRGALFDAALALERLTYSGKLETDPIIAENVVATAYVEAYSMNDDSVLPAPRATGIGDFSSSRLNSDEAGDAPPPDEHFSGLGEADQND